MSIMEHESSVQQLASIKFSYALGLLIYDYYRLILRLVCISIPRPSDRNQTEKRLGVGGHALVSGYPEHWTIQP